jgi:non-specific serine/threonine protein kinase
VAAVLLAVIGYAAWQWLYRPMPADLPLAVSEVAAPAPSVAPPPAPVIPATPAEAAPPVVEADAPPAAAGKAPPGEVTPIGPKSAPAEQAPVQPVPPVRSPREACGERTQFALYLCMQQQCARSAWANHPQCVRLRATDEVE